MILMASRARPKPGSPRGIGIRLLALSSTAAFVGACSTDAPIPSVATERDSVGVTIVENHADGLWDDATGWSVSDAFTEFGSRDGIDALYDVRGAVRFADGRIAVANHGTSEVVLFAGDGSLQMRLGRRGTGPGEFLGVQGVGPGVADSLWAFDMQLGRLTFFAADGSLGRTVTIEGAGGMMGAALTPVGRLSRGDFVFSMNQPSPVDRARADTSSVTPSGGTIYFSGPDGRMRDSISGLRGDDRATAVSAPSSGRLRIRTIPVPFLKTLEASVSGDRVAAGSTDRYEFRLYAPDGRLVRIVRAPHTPRSVDASIIETWIAAQVGQIDDRSERESRTRSLRALPFPETIPSFARLLLDAEGNLWVQEFSDDEATPVGVELVRLYPLITHP